VRCSVFLQEGLENNRSVAHAALAKVWRPAKPSRDLPDADEVRRIWHALREARSSDGKPLESWSKASTVSWSLEKTQQEPAASR